MSTIFSLRRFTHLLKEHWVKTWKSMVVISVIVAGLLALALVYFEVYFEFQNGYRPLKYQEVQQTVFNIGFILLSIGFCLNYYYLNWHGSRKMVVLSMPVSMFERTLLSFVWMTVIFAGWYLLLFYTVNIPLLKWANYYESQAHPLSRYRVEQYIPSKLIGISRMHTISFILLIQTMFFASLLWFKRHAVVKSLAAVFLIVLIYEWFQEFVKTNWLTPKAWVSSKNTLRIMLDPVFTEYNEIQASLFWTVHQDNHLFYVWFVLWGIIYFRMKEQEV